jgi:hypothetical protein
METVEMTQDPRRPLHRLTPLRDDPAAAWLTRPQRLRLTMTRVTAWGTYGLILAILWLGALAIFMPVMGLMMTTFYCMMAAAAITWPVRRIIMRRCSAKIAELVRAGSPDLAVAIDDFTDLERQLDGTVVSIVGWIRAREKLAELVAGAPCIGLALACHQRYPGVLETLTDFDLVDEAGNTILVRVAGARMLGAANVNLSDGNARRMLIASLDLPVGAVATGWDAFVLRDGDPVMAVGFKLTTLDPMQPNLRAPPARASVGSVPPKPLLIFPIAAERRAPAAPASALS